MDARFLCRAGCTSLLIGWLAVSAQAQTAGSQRNTAPPGVGVPRSAAAEPAPVAPSWIPLPPAHAKFVGEILTYWEQRSSEVKRYRCAFKRWEYDPVFGPGADVFKTFAEGEIKYADPDKGLYRVTKLLHYQKREGAAPTYEPREELEHWICDGTSVFEYDYQKKQLIETILPAEMRGEAIGDGPLPFLFGAKAAEIQSRYWVRVITPPEKTQGDDIEYWLEAIPKTQRDAANFRAVHVMIDGKDYLPEGMTLFGRDNKRLNFRFENREVNFSVLAQQLNIFHREFFEPKLPSGWQKVVHNVEQAALPMR